MFAAYLALRRSLDRFNPEYQFTKNNGLALTAGVWCFIVTAACCILGMYVEGDLASTPVKRDHTVCAHRAGSDPADYQEKGSKQPCIKKLLEKF